MIRLTLKQAIDVLRKTYRMDAKSVAKLEKNPIELNTVLIEKSDGMFCLKGTRERTNISYAPNDVQGTYKDAESMMGSIPAFKGKDGFIYECGVYCKKVVKKKNTKK